MNRMQKKIHREVRCSLRLGTFEDASYRWIRKHHRMFHSILEEVLRAEKRGGDMRATTVNHPFSQGKESI